MGWAMENAKLNLATDLNVNSAIKLSCIYLPSHLSYNLKNGGFIMKLFSQCQSVLQLEEFAIQGPL
jgi:hypothetical protein